MSSLPPEKVSDFFLYRNKLRVKKKKSNFRKSAKNVFYRKKIRLQVSKSGDDDDPKTFSDFFFIEIKFRWKKKVIFRKSAKNVLYRKKIRLKVSKSGDDDDQKRFSDFFLYRNEVQVKKCLPIFEDLRKTFSF